MSVIAARASRYEGVYLVRDNHMCQYWMSQAVINGKKYSDRHDNERDAAIAYDLILISNGIMPINIERQ